MPRRGRPPASHGIVPIDVLAYSPPDHELELIEAAYQVALRDQHGKHWRQARNDGRARRRASRIAEQALAAWSELVALGFERIEASDVAGAVPDLVHRYALGSYDAVHAATALAVGADGLMALDSAFARLPKAALTIHTASAKARRMRAIRRGR